MQNISKLHVKVLIHRLDLNGTYNLLTALIKLAILLMLYTFLVQDIFVPYSHR